MARVERVEDLTLSRRALIVGAFWLAGAAATKPLFDRYKSIIFGEPYENIRLAGTEMFPKHPILVSRGANLRTEPRIPPSSRFYTRSNTIPWEEIMAINGTPLEGKDAFVILNTPIAYGQEIVSFFETTSNKWGTVRVTLRNQTDATVYFHMDTSEYVKHLYDYYPVTTKKQPIGHITVPTGKNVAAREVLPSLWADDIRAKFAGDLSLEEKTIIDLGEIVYNNVAVVPSGTSEDDRARNANTPVNVRDFPATEYLSNKEPVNIFGTVAVGTNIRNVLLTQNGFWGAFRFSDLQGELRGANGEVVQLDPNTICAIHANYIFTTDHITYIPNK